MKTFPFSLLVLMVLLPKGDAFYITNKNSPGRTLLSSLTKVLSSPTSTSSVPSRSNKEGGDIHDNAINGDSLDRTKKLSEMRNLKLQQVLNARDLSTCKNSPIKPGKLFRTGRLSEASASDIQLLMDRLQLKTLVDLRSPTELKDDQALMRTDVFGNFTNVVWKDRGRRKEGCVRVLKADESPVKHHRFWKRSKKRNDLVDDMIVGKEDDAADECDECEDLGASIASQLNYGGQRKERLFVPLMNEFKYVKGTVSKLRKRDIVRAIFKSPASIFSKRVRNAIKKPFLDRINDGGLVLLNEFLFTYGAPGIKYVLEICADENRHPVAFFCTAGKDRTGIIAAIILSVCGVSIDDIVEDYSLSANVYAEMNDHKAMVGALQQRHLDAQRFLDAPPQVMKDTLIAIKDQFGSIEDYCEWIGFTAEQQQKLRRAIMKDDLQP